MGTVKIDYIDKALNDLIPALGIREYVDQEKIIALIGTINQIWAGVNVSFVKWGLVE